MIKITGDIHGNINRLLRIIDSMKRGDYLIQLGDAGLNLMNYYNGYPGEDETKKQKLNSAAAWKGVKILFVYGNHEKRASNIETYKFVNFAGAKAFVEAEYPNLIFLSDDIYTIMDKRILVIGGAYSVDWRDRTIGRDWWTDEQPSDETKNYIENRISENNFKCDYVLTHTCPAKYIPSDVSKANLSENIKDYSTEEWLDSVEEKLVDYQGWFCGHWHINREVNTKFHFVFNNTYLLDRT